MAWDDGFTLLSGGDTGSNNMPAFSSIAAGVGAAGSLVGGIGQAFGGGQTVQGFQLPREFEYLFIDNALADLQGYEQDLKQINYAIENYDKRLNVMDAAIDGFIPPQSTIEAMNALSYDLASAFGASAQKMVEQGFLTEDDLQTKNIIDEEISRLQEMRGGEVTDPRLEAQIREQKAQLQQDMVRSGASPTEISMAMRRFEDMASQSRFTRSESLIANRFSQGLQIIGAAQARNQFLQATRMGNFDMARAAKAELDKGLAQIGQAIQGKVNLGGLIQQNQLQGIQMAQETRAQRMGMFETIGKFDLRQEKSINRFLQGRTSGELTGNLSDPRTRETMRQSGSFSYKDDLALFREQTGNPAALLTQSQMEEWRATGVAPENTNPFKRPSGFGSN